MNAEKILAALAGNASYSFEFDVTAGIVENDIIGKSGINYTKKAGLSSPCLFNDLISRFFGEEIKCRFLNNSRKSLFQASIC